MFHFEIIEELIENNTKAIQSAGEIMNINTATMPPTTNPEGTVRYFFRKIIKRSGKLEKMPRSNEQAKYLNKSSIFIPLEVYFPLT